MPRRIVASVCACALPLVAAATGQSQQTEPVTVRGTVKAADGGTAPEIAVVLLPPPGEAPRTARCVVAADGAFAFPPTPIADHRLAVAPKERAASCSEPSIFVELWRGAMPLKAMSPHGTLVVNLIVSADPELRIVRASTTGTMIVGGPRPPGAALPPGAPRPPSMPGAAAPNALPPVTPRPGAISGRLTDPDDQPIAGVAVQAARRSSSAANATLLPFSQAITAEDGTYRIANVPDGELLVIALALRYEAGTGELPHPAVPSTADAEGRRVGLHTTYFPGVPTAAAARPILVNGAEERGVDFTMRRGPVAEVSGHVAGLDRRFFPAGWLSLSPAEAIEQVGGRNVRRAELAADGRFSFADVPHGDYMLFVDGPSGWARERLRVAEAGGPAPLEIALRPGMTVSGTVAFDAARVTVDEAVLKQVQVELRPAQRGVGSPLLRAPVAADRTFTIRRVPGDRYVLTVAGPTFWVPISGTIAGRDTLDFPIELAENATGAVLVLADRDTNLRGTVRTIDSQPATGGRVVIYSEDRRFWTPAGSRRVRVVTVGPGGAYGATGLPPGEYLAKAFPAGARITNSVLDDSRATATRFSLAIGESRVVDLLLVR